jgi:predicted nucleic acid-binding protein
MPKKLSVVANTSPLTQRVTGSLGLLLELYRAGAVSSLETAFAAMKAKGIYLDDRLLQQVLDAAPSKPT